MRRKAPSRAAAPTARRASTARAAAAAATVVLLTCTARAAPDAPATISPPSGVPQVETRGLGGGLTFARAQVDVPWPPARVFDLVSDFDHLGDFVSAIDSSSVVRRDSLSTWVRQVGTTTLLVHKTVHMTLRFQPRRPGELRFEIVAGDFRIYYGAWKFNAAPPGTRVSYDVTFAASPELPGVLVRHVVQRDLERMLRELAAEIARRDAEATPAGR